MLMMMAVTIRKKMPFRYKAIISHVEKKLNLLQKTVKLLEQMFFMCMLSSFLTFLPHLLLLFYIISSRIHFFIFLFKLLSMKSTKQRKIHKRKLSMMGKYCEFMIFIFLLKSYHSRYLSSPLEFLPFNLIAFFFFYNWHFSPLTA